MVVLFVVLFFFIIPLRYWYTMVFLIHLIQCMQIDYSDVGSLFILFVHITLRFDVVLLVELHS